MNDETGEIEKEVAHPKRKAKKVKKDPRDRQAQQDPPARQDQRDRQARQDRKAKKAKTGPQGPPAELILCKVTGKNKNVKVTCTEEGVTAKTNAIVSLARNHKVVAYGRGRLGTKIALEHKAPLNGRYTLFVEIPGRTACRAWYICPRSSAARRAPHEDAPPRI